MGTNRKKYRLNTLKNSLSMQLDDDGRLMIKCAPMFKRELRKILREIKEEARQLVRRHHSKPDIDGTKRTGRLRRSIQVGKVIQVHPRRLQGTVKAGSRLAPYAQYVHDGTPPHVIRARRAKALRFGMLNRYEIESVRTRRPTREPGVFDDAYEKRRVDKGPGIVYRKKVNHPGYKGHPFLNRAAIKVVRRYGGVVKRRDGSIIRRD